MSAKWKSIESAPKDGTMILVCDSVKGKQSGQACSFWSEYDQCWWFINTGESYETITGCNPTHWAEMPEWDGGGE